MDVTPSEQPSLMAEASQSIEEETTVLSIEPPAQAVMPMWRATLIIVTVALMTMMSTVLSGVLAVAFPKVAVDIRLDDSLLLWPASVYSLTCGCTLLLFGKVADALGARLLYLTGSILSTCLILACGVCRTGVQLIIFRAIHGIAIAMCLPSSVALLTGNFKPGQVRNTAFASLDAAQPTGFLVGLVIGGILVDKVTWRVAFYLIAGINAAVFIVALFGLPKGIDEGRDVLEKLRKTDWMGVLLISAALGLLSYVLAAVTIRHDSIRRPVAIVVLFISILLLPAFSIWVHFRVKRGRPALIPNSLWRHRTFTSMSVLTFIAWATVTVYQYFLALTFEKVQLHSALATSLRFLPLVVSGVMANVVTGACVRAVRANVLIGGAIVLSASTPLIMALADWSWPFWYAAFPAVPLSPIAADVILTIANLAISSVFPAEAHGLEGGVNNTVAQLGTSLGLNSIAILATSVTDKTPYSDKTSPAALEVGYRAAFWVSFSATAAMLVVTLLGLRLTGRVGAVE